MTLVTGTEDLSEEGRARWAPMNVVIHGWVVNWALKLDAARVYQATVTEQIWGWDDLDQGVRDELISRATDRCRDKARAAAGLILAEHGPSTRRGPNPVGPPGGELLVVRMRFLTCDRAPLPPESEWWRFR